MQILSVIPVSRGKKKDRYHVSAYLDLEGIEFDMPLYSGELKKYGIIEGAQLPDDIYYEIEEKILNNRIRIRSEYLINDRAYTEYELRKKLRQSYYPERLIDRIINHMIYYHYIDDEDYACRYVELNDHKKSKKLLASELKNKGISQNIIEKALETDEEDQKELLRNMLEKRIRGRDISAQKEFDKQLRYFWSKGFDIESIKEVLSEFQDSRTRSQFAR